MQASLKETTILQRTRQEGQSLVSPKPLGAAGELWIVKEGKLRGWGRRGSIIGFPWDKTSFSKLVYYYSTRELECIWEGVRQLEILQLSLRLTVAGDGCINHTGQVRQSHWEPAAGWLWWKAFINPGLPHVPSVIKNWLDLPLSPEQSATDLRDSQGFRADIWSWQSKRHWVQEGVLTSVLGQMKVCRDRLWILAGDNETRLLLGTSCFIPRMLNYHS